jgi:hypothetical protein
MRRLRLAPGVLATIATFGPAARADDNGCTVISCLSNPADWAAGGPMYAARSEAAEADAKGTCRVVAAKVAACMRIVDVHEHQFRRRLGHTHYRVPSPRCRSYGDFGGFRGEVRRGHHNRAAAVESGGRPLGVRDADRITGVASASEDIAVVVCLLDRGRGPGIVLTGVRSSRLAAVGAGDWFGGAGCS